MVVGIKDIIINVIAEKELKLGCGKMKKLTKKLLLWLINFFQYFYCPVCSAETKNGRYGEYCQNEFCEIMR